MKWNNLRKNKCPQCSKDLFKAKVGNGLIICPCGFRISESKMRQIINSKPNREPVKHYRPDDEVPEEY
jgi:uncharacterized Zn finger protein (UPF0148 family)